MSVNYMLTHCPDHDTTVAPTTGTVDCLAPVASDCFNNGHKSEHILAHVTEGTDCFACCEEQTVFAPEFGYVTEEAYFNAL